METFLDNIHQQWPGHFSVDIPKSLSPIKRNISGQLYMSPSGYVYAKINRPVVWIKFVGLAAVLSIQAVAQKCAEISAFILCKPAPQVESRHLFALLGIACRAVLLVDSISNCVEEFGLKELRYHQKIQKDVLDWPRSTRLIYGNYTAACMQPLFHRDQYTSPITLNEKIENLNKEKRLIESALERRKTPHRSWVKNKVYEVLKGKNLFNDYPTHELEASLTHCVESLNKYTQEFELAKRCEKYATVAILNQQCCVVDNSGLIKSETELSCCDLVTYQQETYCGCIHKINCCAINCWAINCCGFGCCFMPDLNVCCIL